MTCLFIDTATKNLTVSIYKDTCTIAYKSSSNLREHSKYALSSIKEALDESNINPGDIDRIIVTNGPGSFTGIRIGDTIAKTYAWALKKELIPISSLLTYALGYSNYDYYVVLIDARREHVFGAIYDSEYNAVLEDKYISIDDLYAEVSKLNGLLAFIGDINLKEHKVMTTKVDTEKIVNFCSKYNPIEPHSLKPRYLKLVEAEEKYNEANK